jgi:arabinose-5-phosphate isomerase
MQKLDFSAIQAAALRTLDIEIEALANLRASIDLAFCSAVEAIFNSSGRVVVTGIGKSAIVAQKIAATLNSTIHGDLGMLQHGDVLLCLSRSGDTAEIKVLVPLVKSMGNLIIGMVGNRESWLGKQANFILYTPVSKEADPNNLAPTASTTAKMAMGDALAVALLAMRGFTPADFAQFHPGGVLGKQLYLRIRDIYPYNERPHVAPDTGIHETILEMTSRRLGCAVVIGENGRVQGIITDGDLRRMLERQNGDDFSKLKAADVMSRNPKLVDKNDLAVQALKIMREHSITQVIVMGGEEYLGIVHLHDLIREGIL